MKLTKCSFTNLKGLSESFALTDLTIFVGSNFKGKTARMDAIRLGLLGYLPELGKLPSATFGLCSGSELEVVLEFDSGERLMRRWFLKGDAVKTVEEIPAKLAAIGTLAVMLNAEEYFALSDRERVKYVFANVPITYPPDKAAIVAGVDAALAKEHKRERVVAFLAELGAKLDHLAPRNVQEWIEFAVLSSAEIVKSAKEHAAKMEKTAQGLAALRANDAPAVNLEELDRKREELSRDITASMETKARLMAAYNEGRRVRGRREQLASELRSKGGFVARAENLRNRLDAAEHHLSQLPAVADDLLAGLCAEEREWAMTHARLTQSAYDVEAAQASNQRELDGLSTVKACPYCGAAGDGWRAIKEAEMISALAGLKAKREELRHKIGASKTRSVDLTCRIDNLRTFASQRRLAENELNQLKADLALVETQIGSYAAKEQELSGLPEGNAALVAEVETAQSMLNVQNDALHRLDEARRAAMGRAHELKRLAEAETERDDAKADQAVAARAAELLREV